jgi:hypothetical protein
MTHTNDGNILVIKDETGSFRGTGFLLSDKYLVTCHHCICNSNEIFGVYKKQKYSLLWDEYFSKPESDLAAFRVTNINSSPFEHMKEAPAGSEVSIWGYTGAKYKTFPDGFSEEGKLHSESFEMEFNEGDTVGKNPWNRKPALNVRVYKLEGNFDLGFSGSPVFYKISKKLIGMFAALDENNGYVIPIEEILKNFEIIQPLKPDATHARKREILLFVSKPSALNSIQEGIWKNLQEILVKNSIPTRFIEPNQYPESEPVYKVKRVVSDCDGVIVLGFKQIYVKEGVSKSGTLFESFLREYSLPTPWNNLEAGMAVMMDIPIFTISEEGITGGIFGTANAELKIHEFIIQGEDWWKSDIFTQKLNEWFRDVLEYHKVK